MNVWSTQWDHSLAAQFKQRRRLMTHPCSFFPRRRKATNKGSLPLRTSSVQLAPLTHQRRTPDLSIQPKPQTLSQLHGGAAIVLIPRAMADLQIKPDPDAPGASPGALSEEDIYEDTGDLEFNSDPKFQACYLTRVPKYIWDEWSKLDDDAEIEIGTIRQSVETGPNGQKA